MRVIFAIAVALFLSACGDRPVVRQSPTKDTNVSDITRKPQSLSMTQFSFQTFDESNPCYSVRGFFVDFRRVYMPETRVRVKSCLKQEGTSAPEESFEKNVKQDKDFRCEAEATCVYSEVHVTNSSNTDVFYAFHKTFDDGSSVCEIEPKNTNAITTHLPTSTDWERGIRYDHTMLNSAMHDMTDTYCAFFGLKPQKS